MSRTGHPRLPRLRKCCEPVYCLGALVAPLRIAHLHAADARSMGRPPCECRACVHVREAHGADLARRMEARP